ncbi:hypothetical protein [Streptomyces cinerochromogenes]|uniref:hypothetical protein n=1 Tax=Streptomyces cinerochromogenes TaxID=66422 RepID=UPI001670DBA2|nr:hypothetical protein [Streptomyces cinerochromogenes]GGS75517.1 hypothetical protein GCM10010206_42520 [Streptomyces cinerochromogenes]
MSQTPNRTNRPASRVALRRQIVALAGFALCVVSMLVSGFRAVNTSAGPPSPGTGSATRAPALPWNGASGRGGGGGGGAYVAPGAATEGNVTAPAGATDVPTLVIVGVAGTSVLLSGITVVLTLRRSARAARRQQDGPCEPVPAAATDVTGIS